MNNYLQVFENSKFGTVRMLEEDGRILFCGYDVAAALGYANARDALNRHCRYVVKRYVPHPQAPGKTIEMAFMSEGDVYRLIAKSKLPAAEEFEAWVFEEVLPGIRRNGAYMTPQVIEEVLVDKGKLVTLVNTLNAERQQVCELKQATYELRQQAELDKPKVLFADAVSASGKTILIGELAKLLKSYGVDIGQNRLFERLRADGYLISRGESYNLPTQRAMELGLFKVKESVIAEPDGRILVSRTTKVTGKGQQYFINKYASDKPAEPPT